MSPLAAGALSVVLVGFSLWLGYLIGRAVECSSQADKRRGWK